MTSMGESIAGPDVCAPEHYRRFAWPWERRVVETLGAEGIRMGLHICGDATRIVLWGHSSGGAHVADYLAERARAGADDRVAGAVLLSSFYDLGRSVSVWSAYYGDDVSTYARRSTRCASSRTRTRSG